MVEFILYFLVALVVYLNFLTTVSLIRSKDLSFFKKIAQFVFAWLIPILGAKFVLHMLSDSEPSSTKWIPQFGHGWLIIGNTYHDSLHGRDDSSNDFSSGSGSGGND